LSGERFLFRLQNNQNFTFSPVLDGISYDAEIKWQAERWWLFISGLCSVPIVSSPDDHDIQLVNNTTTNFVYRASCQSFEVGFDKKQRVINLIKNAAILTIQDTIESINIYQDDGFSENILIDLGN